MSPRITCLCPIAMYMYKLWHLLTFSLNPLEQFQQDFTLGGLLSKGCWQYVQNGSAPLNKMAAIPIYGKTLKKSLFSSFEPESWYNSTGDSKFTKFI